MLAAGVIQLDRHVLRVHRRCLIRIEVAKALRHCYQNPPCCDALFEINAASLSLTLMMDHSGALFCYLMRQQQARGETLGVTLAAPQLQGAYAFRFHFEFVTTTFIYKLSF
jgi:hypothetical protein